MDKVSLGGLKMLSEPLRLLSSKKNFVSAPTLELGSRRECLAHREGGEVLP